VLTWLEFFAGGGMARAGLGDAWTPLLSNDFCPKKNASYLANWGALHMQNGDIANVSLDAVCHPPALAWASFPCQDLSVAGAGSGLSGARSSAYWAFIAHMDALLSRHCAPSVIALENVTGLLSPRSAADFEAVCASLVERGYWLGAVVMDAIEFVPQSRSRVFIVASRHDNPRASTPSPDAHWHPAVLQRAVARLPASLQRRWRWWTLPPVAPREQSLCDVLEPTALNGWHAIGKTNELLSMMSVSHRDRIREQQASGARFAGTLHRRTRLVDGKKVQRAEVRFDGVAGCLCTPKGGSSRQTIVCVENGDVKTRLMTPREAARIMGLPDDYRLPPGVTEALFLLGDGVVVPVVAHLAAHLLVPLAKKD
jgi:DNA (cytosine-5)-methyltransferase 1